MSYPIYDAEIRARLDALEARVESQRGYQEFSLNELRAEEVDRDVRLSEVLDGFRARLERLESARIAAPVAPESAETASGVSVEPGNATEAHRGAPCVRCGLPTWDDDGVRYHSASGSFECDAPSDALWLERSALAFLPFHLQPDVRAALRMYRKVQECRNPRGSSAVYFPGSRESFANTAAGLLAWLKEGEA